MLQLTNLSQLTPEIQETIKLYCEELLELHKENLRAIIAYGETLEPKAAIKKTPLTLLILFETITVATLKDSLHIIQKGKKKGVVPPLFLTIEHIRTSTDVFPIEFLEIKENHLTIYGEDIFDNLKISPAHLRLQCEQELKGKLIRLRQNYLETGLAKGTVENLILNSFFSFIPVFKSILRLKNKTVPKNKKQLIEQLCREYTLNENIFMGILSDGKRDGKINGKDVLAFFEDYLGEIKKLSQCIDKM